METNRPTLHTIGHTTHSESEFIALLRRHAIDVVADVRSKPYSRRLEQFNRELLADGLRRAGVQYVYLGDALGARRDESECYDGAMADYARIAQMPSFRKGLDRLRHGARQFSVAVMCAEKEPLDCHRAILICRQLRREFHILHILADGSTEDHEHAEKRLVRQMGVARSLFEPDLSTDDLVQLAYDQRAKQIAFRAGDDGDVL